MIAIVKKVKEEEKLIYVELGVSGMEVKLMYEDVEKIG